MTTSTNQTLLVSIYPSQHILSYKKYMKNRAKPEGWMALGYMCNEALGFVIEYLALYPHTRHQIWDANEEEANLGENLSGNGMVKMWV